MFLHWKSKAEYRVGIHPTPPTPQCSVWRSVRPIIGLPPWEPPISKAFLLCNSQCLTFLAVLGSKFSIISQCSLLANSSSAYIMLPPHFLRSLFVPDPFPLSSIIYSQLPPSLLLPGPCSHSRSPIIVARNNMDSFFSLSFKMVENTVKRSCDFMFYFLFCEHVLQKYNTSM